MPARKPTKPRPALPMYAVITQEFPDPQLFCQPHYERWRDGERVGPATVLFFEPAKGSRPPCVGCEAALKDYEEAVSQWTADRLAGDVESEDEGNE